jgi:hypothetical protein
MLTKPTAVVARKATKEIRNRLDKIDKDMVKILSLLEDNLIKLDKKLAEQELKLTSLKRNMSELRDNVNINRAIVTGNQKSLAEEIKRDAKRMAIKAGIALFAAIALVKVLFF